MSTSAANRGAPVADEFPVLLRLPDLNAPVWTPPTVPAANASVDQMSAASTTGTSPTSESVASAAVMRLESLTSTIPNMASANLSASLASSSVDVAAAAPASEAVTLPTSRSERLSRAELPAFTRWSLVRQLTTGGVLVGGLALTYLAVMSGGSRETPSHIAKEQTSVEPPKVDVPDLGSMPVKPIEAAKTAMEESSPVKSDISPVPAPPAFPANWEVPVDTTKDQTPRVAETTGDQWSGARDAMKPRVEITEPSPGTFVAPAEPRGRTETGEYRGRIGPAPREASIRYQETDPNTYLYRPTSESTPDAGRPGMARLNGTIAPPPLR